MYTKGVLLSVQTKFKFRAIKQRDIKEHAHKMYTTHKKEVFIITQPENLFVQKPTSTYYTASYANNLLSIELSNCQIRKIPSLDDLSNTKYIHDLYKIHFCISQSDFFFQVSIGYQTMVTRCHSTRKALQT